MQSRSHHETGPVSLTEALGNDIISYIMDTLKDDIDGYMAIREFTHVCKQVYALCDLKKVFRELEQALRAEYTWHIKGFLKHKEHQIFSPTFAPKLAWPVGSEWRIMVYPRGNNIKDEVSVYLQTLRPVGKENEEGVSIQLSFSMPPIYHDDRTMTHRYSIDKLDYGLRDFYPRSDLEKNLQEDDTLVLNAKMIIQEWRGRKLYVSL